jgi:hypothetical protein
MTSRAQPRLSLWPVAPPSLDNNHVVRGCRHDRFEGLPVHQLTRRGWTSRVLADTLNRIRQQRRPAN